MTIICVIRVISITNGIQSGLAQYLAQLDRGSTLWAAKPQSPLEQAQLMEINLELKKWAVETSLLTVTSFERFRFGECVYLSFTLATCPVSQVQFNIVSRLAYFRYPLSL